MYKDPPIYLHIGKVAAKLQLLTGEISRLNPGSQDSYMHGGCRQIVGYNAACYDRCLSRIHHVLWGWLKENTELMHSQFLALKLDGAFEIMRHEVLPTEVRPTSKLDHSHITCRPLKSSTAWLA